MILLSTVFVLVCVSCSSVLVSFSGACWQIASFPLSLALKFNHF